MISFGGRCSDAQVATASSAESHSWSEVGHGILELQNKSFWKIQFLSFQLLAEGFTLMTHQVAKLYFISFYVIAIILVVK